MCGIYFYRWSGSGGIKGSDRLKLETNARILAHRGPDETVVRYYGAGAMVAFHRLRVMDPIGGGQPFEHDGRFVCMANAEIYNDAVMRARLLEMDPQYKFTSFSDCESLVHIFAGLMADSDHYLAMGKLVDAIDGEYAIVIYDIETGIISYAVDQLRTRPLYIGLGNGELTIASEVKAITGGKIISIQSGTYGVLHPDGKHERSMSTMQRLTEIVPRPVSEIAFDAAALRVGELLQKNIIGKLSAERERGFLLSGGLDSSIVAAVAARHFGEHHRIRTFTIGFSATAPDVLAARVVAKHIRSIHTEVIVSFEEGLSALRDVIRIVETWDQTTIRASTPMLLLLRAIKEKHPEMAVIFSGEVADELFRGYLYNLAEPSAAEGRTDSINRLANITWHDGQRADRVISSVGCEARYGFFGRELLDYVLSLPAEYVSPHNISGGDFAERGTFVEKMLLRVAFANSGLLPNEILWRTKAAFSDATSEASSWKDFIKQHAETVVHQSRLDAVATIYPRIAADALPRTKEDLMYLDMFDELIGITHHHIIPYKWMPTWGAVQGNDSSATMLRLTEQ